MSLIIEKVDNTYIVSHPTGNHDNHPTFRRQTATAKHVANLIAKFWPEVAQFVRETKEEQVFAKDDQITNR
jgi:hypothetical protein